MTERYIGSCSRPLEPEPVRLMHFEIDSSTLAIYQTASSMDDETSRTPRFRRPMATWTQAARPLISSCDTVVARAGRVLHAESSMFIEARDRLALTHRSGWRVTFTDAEKKFWRCWWGRSNRNWRHPRQPRTTVKAHVSKLLRKMAYEPHRAFGTCQLRHSAGFLSKPKLKAKAYMGCP